MNTPIKPKLTEAEKMARYRLYGAVVIAIIAAGLVVGGWLTGAQWLQTVTGVFG